MAYVRGERQQTQLFPASLEDYVGGKDPVRVYDAFVNQLDFRELGIVLDDNQMGPPEFDPQAMVKLLVYGYAYGIRSSRKLERALYHNVSFMWLVGGLKPDHKTIARFRRDHREAMKGILKQCVRLCVQLGLIEGNTLFVDGTKIRANAGMRESWSKERCDRVLKRTDEHIERILKECENVDASESGDSSLVNHPELQDAEALKAKVQAIAETLKKSGKPVLNTTDPDCRHMQGRQGTHAAYNVQLVVDDMNSLIVQSDAVEDVNDRHQLANQATQANQTLGKPCETICADAGYDHNPSWKELEDQGISVVVKANDQKPSGPFTKDQFRYDAGRDCYVCPVGQTLAYRSTDKKTQHRIYTVANATICRTCPQKMACSKSWTGRTIARIPLEEIRPVVQARYESPAGQVLYARRQCKVEHPFGHIKRNLGVQAFLLRGLAGVRAEAALLATCFNIARMMTLVGVGGLLPEPSTA
ncbi:MAG: IS1182 family transposase [Acidobacteriales bacterium]|nr:IS1182 family transposase [Terriglobales bacterium]